MILLSACMLAATAATGSVELPFETTRVVLGDDVTARFAAEELNEIVKKSTGREFAVADASGAAHRIFIGRNADVDRIVGKARLDSLGVEESLVCSKGGDVFLVGGDAAGTLWAVYDFVEDNLGYRWYQECRDDRRAEREIVDKTDKVVFCGVATRRKPGFDGYRRDHENWGYFRRFRLRHRSNSEIERFVPGYVFKYRGRTLGHGFDQFLPRKTDLPWMKLKEFPAKVKALAPAFEKHPELFSVGKDGRRTDTMQLCLSSKATRDAIWQSLQWWVEHRGPGIYMLGSNDEHTGTYCYCEGCLALEKKYGVSCGAMWDCVLDICARLKAAKMDGVYLTSLAYRHQTQICPAGVTFPDNFICDFAPVTWDRALSEVKDETLPDGRIYNWLQNAKDWGRACRGGVSYWYYGSSICGYTWGRMSKELREVYDAGVRSAGYCGLEGGYEFEDLMHHMWFWCLYNPHGDARAEFARACAAKYGPAADAIMRYTDMLEAVRRRMVAATPCGPSALDILSNATVDELDAMSRLLDGAVAAAAGTKYAENASWARVSLDVALFFRKGDSAAEARARAAATGYFSKVAAPMLMRKTNVVEQRLDQMANYANLKSDELPPELAKYPRDKVTRVLPAKSAPYAPYGRAIAGKMWSEPDAGAVCGFAMTDALPREYARDGADSIRVGLYNHDVGKYLIPFNNLKIPKSFWERDKYKLFRMGVSSYAPRTVLIWTDTRGSCVLGYSPLDTQLLSRLYDSVNIDRQFETWISIKAQGPMFFDGDTRENRIFIEQIFSVEL